MSFRYAYTLTKPFHVVHDGALVSVGSYPTQEAADEAVAACNKKAQEMGLTCRYYIDKIENGVQAPKDGVAGSAA